MKWYDLVLVRNGSSLAGDEWRGPGPKILEGYTVLAEQYEDDYELVLGFSMADTARSLRMIRDFG